MIKFLKLLKDTHEGIKSAEAATQELSQQPWDTLLELWEDRQEKSADGAKGLSPPTNKSIIQETELALGHALPEEVSNFYLTANGIWESDKEEDKFILEVEKLKTSNEWEFVLSQSLDSDWNEIYKEEGEPRALRIFGTDVVKLMNDDEDLTVPYSDIDEFIPLSAPNEDMTAVLVSKTHNQLPIGTVLLIENGVATNYLGLKYYIASHLLIESFDD